MKFNRYAKYHYLKILRLKDTPYKVAKGVALGVTLDFLPLPFISLLIAYIIAKVARFNSIAAVTTAAVLKPAVFLIFWPLNLLVGRMFLGEQSQISQIDNVPEPENIFKLNDYVLHMLDYLKHLGTPFLLGSLINATISGVLVYLIVSRLLLYRQQRRLKKMTRSNSSAIE